MSYVRAAKELPRLSEEEIDARAREYGAISSDEEAAVEKDAVNGDKDHDSEKEEVA